MSTEFIGVNWIHFSHFHTSWTHDGYGYSIPKQNGTMGATAVIWVWVKRSELPQLDGWYKKCKGPGVSWVSAFSFNSFIWLARRLIPGQSGPLDRATEQCSGSASPEFCVMKSWADFTTQNTGTCWKNKKFSPGFTCGICMKGVELDITWYNSINLQRQNPWQKDKKQILMANGNPNQLQHQPLSFYRCSFLYGVIVS